MLVPSGSAVSDGRTLEGICTDFQASGRTLKNKLEDLNTKGIIEMRLFDWADDVLRTVGNNAAHDVDKVVSREDASDTLEFTKAIMEYLYVLEAAFKRFKERQQEEEDETPPA